MPPKNARFEDDDVDYSNGESVGDDEEESAGGESGSEHGIDPQESEHGSNAEEQSENVKSAKTKTEAISSQKCTGNCLWACRECFDMNALCISKLYSDRITAKNAEVATESVSGKPKYVFLSSRPMFTMPIPLNDDTTQNKKKYSDRKRRIEKQGNGALLEF